MLANMLRLALQAIRRNVLRSSLTILGIGLSGLIGSRFVGEKISLAPHLYIPGLTDIPLVGRILFGEDAFVYLSLALVIGVWFFLYRTKYGLEVRCVGENPKALDVKGLHVGLRQCLAIMFGSMFLNEVLAPQDFVGLALIALGLAAIDGRLLRLLALRSARQAA